jgi:hypothetical protein
MKTTKAHQRLIFKNQQRFLLRRRNIYVFHNMSILSRDRVPLSRYGTRSLHCFFVGQGRAVPFSSSDENNTTRPSSVTTLSGSSGYHPRAIGPPLGAGVTVSNSSSSLLDPHRDLCSPMSLFEELEPPLQIHGTRDEDEIPPIVLPWAEPSQPVLPLVDLLPPALPLVEPSPPVLPAAEPSPSVLPLAKPSPKELLPLDNEHSPQQVLMAGVSSPVLSGPLSSVSSGSSQYFTPDPSPSQSPRHTQGEENTAGEVEIQTNKKKGETSQTDIFKRKVSLFPFADK